jgi:hypothetical protein
MKRFGSATWNGGRQRISLDRERRGVQQQSAPIRVQPLSKQSTRLPSSYGNRFPEAYRTHTIRQPE